MKKLIIKILVICYDINNIILEHKMSFNKCLIFTCHLLCIPFILVSLTGLYFGCFKLQPYNTINGTMSNYTINECDSVYTLYIDFLYDKTNTCVLQYNTYKSYMEAYTEYNDLEHTSTLWKLYTYDNGQICYTYNPNWTIIIGRIVAIICGMTLCIFLIIRGICNIYNNKKKQNKKAVYELFSDSDSAIISIRDEYLNDSSFDDVNSKNTSNHPLYNKVYDNVVATDT